MKRATKTIIITMIIVVLSFTLLACSEGKAGKSAYEIALDNGFIGSEQEWLESLHGQNGTNGVNGNNGLNGKDGVDAHTVTPESLLQMYNDAVTNGYKGSYVEFLKELNIDAKGVISSGDNTAAINSALRSVVSINAYLDDTMKKGSAGAGIIYKLDKLNGNATIITNYHVVYMANEPSNVSQNIYVYLYGEEISDAKIRAKYIGGSEYYDIAVLQVSNDERLKASNAQEVVVETNPILVGNTAIAIGNPQGTGISTTEGIISKDSEYIPITSPSGRQILKMRVMRIDTIVNRGNSGGGLFNEKGHLIGIVNAKSVEYGVDGVNYAIPLDIVLAVANNIIDTCDGQETRLMIGKLGTQVSVVDSKLTEKLIDGQKYYTTKETIEITKVNDGFLGKKAGMAIGDRLVSVEIKGVTYPIERLFTLNTILIEVRANTDLTFNILRKDESGEYKEKQLTLTIAEGDLVEADVDKFNNQ